MKIINPTCVNGLNFEDSDQGKHHRSLHEKIFLLEKENSALKDSLALAKDLSENIVGISNSLNVGKNSLNSMAGQVIITVD